MRSEPTIKALRQQVVARQEEAAAAERGASASFQRAQALRAVVEALDDESMHVSDDDERARLEHEARLSLREADLVEGEGRRLFSERDRALGQARTAEVKCETIIHRRR